MDNGQKAIPRADACSLNALFWQGRSRFDVDTERLDHIDRSTIRRHRAGSVPHHGQTTSRRHDGRSCADVECLQEVPARPAVVDQGLNSVDLNLDGVVFVERLESTRDFLRRFRLPFEGRYESTLLQIGLLLLAYLPPAVSRFLTRNVFAPKESRDNSAETPQALFSRLHLLYLYTVASVPPAAPRRSRAAAVRGSQNVIPIVRYRRPAVDSEVRVRSNRPVRS